NNRHTAGKPMLMDAVRSPVPYGQQPSRLAEQQARPSPSAWTADTAEHADQGLLELRTRNRHSVTCGHFALLRQTRFRERWSRHQTVWGLVTWARPAALRLQPAAVPAGPAAI